MEFHIGHACALARLFPCPSEILDLFSLPIECQGRNPQANLFYLKIDRAILYQPGVKFATGVGYANNAETVTLDEAIARDLIDFQVLYTWMPWGDPQVKPRRRAAELCEILVPDYVPMTFIRNSLFSSIWFVHVISDAAILTLAGTSREDKSVPKCFGGRRQEVSIWYIIGFFVRCRDRHGTDCSTKARHHHPARQSP
jgi:hypothetical protein